MMREYQICTKTVMDTSDSKIIFDQNGVCDHVHDFEKNVKPNWYPNEEGKIRLESTIEKIKKRWEEQRF